MLKSWSIENFKPIVNSGELKLAPVTVLAGRNSSGKSSLLQSILMIAQTLSNQLPERALLPNERIVQLGTFEDILSEFSDSRNLAIQFEISDERENIDLKNYRSSMDHKVTVIFGSGNIDNSSSSAIEASRVMVEKTSLQFRIGSSDNNTTNYIEGNFVAQKIAQSELKRLLDNISPEKRTLSSANDKYNYLGEYTYSESYDGNISQNTQSSLLVTLSHFLPDELLHIS